MTESAKGEKLEEVKQKANEAFEQTRAYDLPAHHPIQLGMALS